MIYLESQDIFIPATYIGAPKICFHCRLAGHIRNDCPELAAIQCHKCNGYGHFRRYCKSKPIDDDFNKELLEYERAQRQQDLQDQITEEMTKTAEEMAFDKYQEEQTTQQVDELMIEELEAATYKQRGEEEQLPIILETGNRGLPTDMDTSMEPMESISEEHPHTKNGQNHAEIEPSDGISRAEALAISSAKGTVRKRKLFSNATSSSAIDKTRLSTNKNLKQAISIERKLGKPATKDIQYE